MVILIEERFNMTYKEEAEKMSNKELKDEILGLDEMINKICSYRVTDLVKLDVYKQVAMERGLKVAKKVYLT